MEMVKESIMCRRVFAVISFTIFFSSTLLADKVVDYVGIGVAKQSVDNREFSSGSSLIVNTGKDRVADNLGIEIEGTFPLDKPDATISGKKSSMKFWSMGMYGTYIWKINRITIKPRLGLIYENIQSAFNTSNKDKTKPIDRSFVGLSGGVGLSYNLTKKYKIYTNYTKFEDDINHLTFGAEFKF
jgi:opacity protein-like surface antigen